MGVVCIDDNARNQNLLKLHAECSSFKAELNVIKLGFWTDEIVTSTSS
jgi:hypothetical protein